MLLASTAEKGHFNPLVGPAQHLRRDGHEVGWLIVPDEECPQLAELDIEPVRCPGTPAPPLTTNGEALARLVRDPRALRPWIKTLLLDAVPAQVAPLQAALQAWAPDVVIADPMLYQVALACHARGTPWLAVSSSLNPVVPDTMDAELVRTIAALAPQRRALFARHGLPDARFAVADHLSPWGTTVFSTPGYADIFGPPPAGVTLVGPSVPLSPRGDEPPDDLAVLPDGRPLVYASFGSQVAWQPARFETLAAATAAIDATLVASVGELADTPWVATLPDHVVALRYAPQRMLLDRAAVLVTHGGANSVMEALHAGVPLLISPICNDQPLQARFVVGSRAGLELDLDSATVVAVADALASLIAGTGAPGLPAVSAAYRATNGGARVAEMAVGLISSPASQAG